MGKGRMTIGLYNSYDASKFREPHRRILARAGDLAMAFDMNLALFGFPIPEDMDTPVKIAEWVAGTTSIGERGNYFTELAERGRFMRFPYPAKGFPPQLGDPILTTSKPIASKEVTLKQVAEIVNRGRSVLFVFGIGPHGVPKDVSAIPNMNLDITGGKFSLETCTALGAVCGAISAELDQ